MANSVEGREKRELEEHEKLMKVGDEGILKTKGPAYAFYSLFSHFTLLLQLTSSVSACVQVLSFGIHSILS